MMTSVDREGVRDVVGVNCTSSKDSCQKGTAFADDIKQIGDTTHTDDSTQTEDTTEQWRHCID